MADPRFVLFPMSTGGYPSEFQLLDPANPPLLSGLSILQRAELALTNAQIKALPTAALVAVLAPPAGSLLIVHAAVLLVDGTAGVYTNIDAGATISLVYTGGAIVAAVPILESTGDVTKALAAAVQISAMEGFLLPIVNPRASLDGLGLTLAVANGALGNFTGGNVANSGKLVVLFSTVKL